MRILLITALMLAATSALADDCITTVTGRKVCRPATAAAVNNSTTATVTTANQVKTVQTNAGTTAAYNPNTGTAATSQKYANGATTVQTNNGTSAAYNPNTGKVATQQTTSNGVKTTQTSGGGQMKSKNGVGVVETPSGKKCYKTANNQGCKP